MSDTHPRPTARAVAAGGRLPADSPSRGGTLVRQPWVAVRFAFALLAFGCGGVVDVPHDAGGDSGSTTSSSPSPPSCQGLPASCGPSGNDDCCASPLVTGGTFYRSYDVANDAASGNTMYPATVSDFRLDRYEVTVGRFRMFVNAGQGIEANPPPAGSGANPHVPGSGWDPSWNSQLAPDTASLVAALRRDPYRTYWTDSSGPKDDFPINLIAWTEAFAFCAWDGGFLPTEAEWNYAAAGGSEQRALPWSNPPGSTAIDCVHANAGGGCANSDGYSQANAVGSESPQGDGRWGQSDLAGNVWEYVLDWYLSAYSNPCVDCAVLGPIPETMSRVNRGGSFFIYASDARTGFRNQGGVGYAGNGDFGVRCARSK